MMIYTKTADLSVLQSEALVSLHARLLMVAEVQSAFRRAARNSGRIHTRRWVSSIVPLILQGNLTSIKFRRLGES